MNSMPPFSRSMQDPLLAEHLWPQKVRRMGKLGVVACLGIAIALFYNFFTVKGTGSNVLAGVLLSFNRTPFATFSVMMWVLLIEYLILLYASIAAMLNRTSIHLAQKNLIFRMHPLPLFWREKSFQLDDIEDVIVESQSGSGSIAGQLFHSVAVVRKSRIALVDQRVLWDVGTEAEASRLVQAIRKNIPHLCAESIDDAQGNAT